MENKETIFEGTVSRNILFDKQSKWKMKLYDIKSAIQHIYDMMTKVTENKTKPRGHNRAARVNKALRLK